MQVIVDGFYSGAGRFCRTLREAEEWAARHRREQLEYYGERAARGGEWAGLAARILAGLGDPGAAPAVELAGSR